MNCKASPAYLMVTMIGIGLLFPCMGIVTLSIAGDILIIGNRDVPVNALTMDEIKSIFLGEKVKWDDGRSIAFALLTTDAHEEFLKKYLSSTPPQYRQYWKKMVFTGKAKSPPSIESVQQLIEYVAKTPGAVGYIPSEASDARVKVISVK